MVEIKGFRSKFHFYNSVKPWETVHNFCALITLFLR